MAAGLFRRLLWAALLQLTLLAAPSGSAERAARIGYLAVSTRAADADNGEAFRRGLLALGYEEGRNAVIEARYADGDPDRLAELAADIARSRVDVIVAATTPAVRAAQRAAPSVPVIMAFAGDPVGDGLVSSLAHPGGNTTGFSAAVTEIAAKRVEFLRAVLPDAKQFILLATPAASLSMVSASERAGRALGVAVRTVRVRSAADVARALSDGSIGRVDGIIVDLAIRRDVAQIIDLAGRRRLPTISGPREFAAHGGLLAYGADYPDLFRRSASHVDRILRGTPPADLPVEQPTKFKLVVNLRTARALGLTIPVSLLTQADETIE